jgi:hypothetical protein
MVRIAVILALGAFACDVGAIPGHGPDGSMGSGDGSSGVVCENISATPPAGHHNAGMGCMTAAQCHNTALGLGLNAPAYSYGGTLYHDAGGTTPFVGATIFVKLGGTERKVVTADNGNFWFTPGTGGIESPTNTATANTKASGCPDTTSMQGSLVQGGGNCNNCHKNGGTTSPIHLP